MPSILHVLDEPAGWEQRVAVGQLVERLPAGEHPQHVVALGGNGVAAHLGTKPVHPVSMPLGSAALAAPGLQRFARTHAIDLVHAWGATAAAAARAAFLEKIPLAVTIFEPHLPARQVRLLRTVASSKAFAVICSAERVRRRLVEQGIAYEQTVLLRPGVDFAAINAAREGNIRSQLGIPSDALLILATDPPQPGHFSVLWSALVRWHLDNRVRLILPGRAAGAQVRLLRELRRLADGSQSPDLPLFTGDSYTFAQLCAAADVLAVGDVEDVSTTPVAWAMASSLPIIAPATYALSELLTHDVNAILFKAPTDRRRRGVALCALYDRLPSVPKLKDVARGHAFEVFSLRRCIEQHRLLYRNLMSGHAPAEGIADPARIAG